MGTRIGQDAPYSSLPRYGAWLAAAIVTAVFVVLSAWTWRKWPDVLIDFGRELYLPWQLVSGKVLYRDLAHLNGPLSPYLNALWFRIFGISLTTLVFANLAITAALTATVFFLIRRSSDTVTTVCSCIVFLCVSAFAHFTWVGNYNFVCPYSHELTHGIALSVFMILFLSRSVSHPRLITCAASGFCLGLVFLTKAEVFAAALAAAIVGSVLVGSAATRESSPRAPLICAFWTAAILPPAFFLAYLGLYMDFSQALQAIAGTWPHIVAADPLRSPFYRVPLGIAAPRTSLMNLGTTLLGPTLFLGSVVLFCLDYAGWRNRLLALLSALALLALSFLVRVPTVPWLLVPEPLPVVTCLAAIALFIYCATNRPPPDVISRLAPLCLWAAFSFFLLAKIILNPKFHHYGFGLAMPGAILLVVLLVRSLPSLVSMLGGRTRLFRMIVMPILAADLTYYVLLSNMAYQQKTYAVGSGPDTMLTYTPSADPRGSVVARTLQQMEQTFPPEAGVAVLPEGVMINYLARRPNPSPYISLMPIELAVFGEARILASLQAHPPRFIILADKNTDEYGVGPFGIDPGNGKSIMDWLQSRYEPAWHTRGESLADGAFTIAVLKLTNEGNAPLQPADGQAYATTPSDEGKNPETRSWKE